MYDESAELIVELFVRLGGIAEAIKYNSTSPKIDQYDLDRAIEILQKLKESQQWESGIYQLASFVVSICLDSTTKFTSCTRLSRPAGRVGLIILRLLGGAANKQLWKLYTMLQQQKWFVVGITITVHCQKLKIFLLGKLVTFILLRNSYRYLSIKAVTATKHLCYRQIRRIIKGIRRAPQYVPHYR